MLRGFRTIRVQMLSLFCIMLLAILSVSAIANAFIARQMQRSVESTTQQLMNKSLQSMESYFRDIKRIGTALAYNNVMQQLLNMESLSERIAAVDTIDDARSVLINTSTLKDSIVGIQLLDTKGRAVVDNANQVLNVDYEATIHNIPSEISFSDVYFGTTNPIWSYLRPPFFYMYLPVYSLTPVLRREVIGLLTMTLNLKDLSAILTDIQPSKRSVFMLLDNRDTVISCTDAGRVGNVMSKEDAHVLDDSYAIEEQSIPIVGWRLRAEVFKPDITASLSQMKLLIAVLAAVFIAAAGTLLLLVLRGVSQPVARITQQMRNIEEARHTPRLAFNNEFGEITTAFYQMLGRLDALGAEHARIQRNVYEMELSSKQWELDAILSQLNPHFLYNTLEYIRGMALIGGQPELADTIMALAWLLRYSIKASDTSCVGMEIQCVMKYARIIDRRFTGRIRVEIDCPEALHELPIQKMLLQPLVENAVLHGLETKLDGGRVTVRVERANRNLLLVVADDGVGIDPAVIEDILKAEQRTKAGGLGLYSILRRLNLAYGERTQFTIESLPAGGTMVRILLPIDPLKDAGEEEVSCTVC